MPTDSEAAAIDLRELRPVRCAEWVDRDGVVVVACPRPEGPWWREIPAWFRWWTGPQRLRLDALGSEVWQRIDGEATLGDIVGDLEGSIEAERAESLDDRVALFVTALQRLGMLELRG